MAVEGGGRVAAPSAGIDCEPDCTGWYASGTSVTLDALPDSGSKFAGWEGSCLGNAPQCTLSMTAARSVIARFAPLPPPGHELVLAVDGDGRVRSLPEGIDCPGQCTHRFDQGSSVTLLAEGSGGTVLLGWSGDCEGSGACTLAMDAPRQVGASFGAAPGSDPIHADGFESPSPSPTPGSAPRW